MRSTSGSDGPACAFRALSSLRALNFPPLLAYELLGTCSLISRHIFACIFLPVSDLISVVDVGTGLCPCFLDFRVLRLLRTRTVEWDSMAGVWEIHTCSRVLCYCRCRYKLFWPRTFCPTRHENTPNDPVPHQILWLIHASSPIYFWTASRSINDDTLHD